MPNMFKKYGEMWPEGVNPLKLEMRCIQLGGRWGPNKEKGMGLFYHYKELQKLIWPKHEHHRWSDLALQAMLDNKITVLIGPKSSGKTHYGAKFAVTDYLCFPNTTGILVSSTTIETNERRIFGEIKMLMREAKENHDWLPGNLIGYKHAIITDDREDTEYRDMRNGILAIACKVGNTYVGLGNYIGFKNRRVRLIGDECQLMGEGFIDSVTNLDGNDDFKAVFIGNPKDTTDQLGRVSEPVRGWTSLPEPEKTSTWETRFMNGIAVNFVGTDSPNFDFPQDQPSRYRFLIDKRRIEDTGNYYGTDSPRYYMMCVGVFKVGLEPCRVITRALCVQHGAFDKCVWGPGPRQKIYGIDAAYSGTSGDRCVAGVVEMGYGIDGMPLLKVYPQKIIPIRINPKLRADQQIIAEDQIAQFVQQDIAEMGIPIENVFYDSTGRGTLGSAFARIFGTRTPVPVEFGGKPTQRPVREDLYTSDKDGKKRLKLCSEHYSKFVTELWFSVRYMIESNQIRELPEEVAAEGYQRMYDDQVRGDKIEIETKEDMKERTGESPDLFDCLATCVEGARQRGFKIQRLGVEFTESSGINFVDEYARKHHTLWRKKNLSYK